MIPKSRTDRLFGTGSSGQDEDVDVEILDSTSHDEVSSAAKSRTSSTKKVKPQSKERSVRLGRVLYPEDDFKEAKEAMGGPIKAAYHCQAFVQFLDKSEKRELAAYKAEQEAEDSEKG